jgi:MFS family permease
MGLYVPFAGYAAMLVAAVFVLFFVRGTAQSKTIIQKAARVPVRQMIGTLARNRSLIGMGLAFTVMWTATMGRTTFETLYMTRLGANTGIIGIAGTVSALFEVPSMLLADYLVHRHGSRRILRISLLAQAVSFLPVVLFPTIPSFFVLRIMASIAMSLNVPAYYKSLVENAPADQGGTVVSLFDVTLRNGVSLLAAPLAGFLFDLLGAYWLYPIGLGGCLLAWFILQLLARPVPAVTV